MANMWYSKEVGGFVRRVPGTDRVIKLGGAEDVAMKKRGLEKRRKLREELKFDRKKDYSGDFAGLFGSDKGGDLHYSGPNARWWNAMSDRMQSRKEGNWNYKGYYEGSTQSMDPALQRQMARRNNAIEAMMRQGYSHQQMLDHTSGKRNVLTEGPDWADYNKHLADYQATLGEGDKYERQWFDNYYQGQDKSHLKRTFEWERPQATGGFLSSYNENKPAPSATAQADSTDAPAASQRASVASLFDSFMNKRRGQ